MNRIIDWTLLVVVPIVAIYLILSGKAGFMYPAIGVMAMWLAATGGDILLAEQRTKGS